MSRHLHKEEDIDEFYSWRAGDYYKKVPVESEAGKHWCHCHTCGFQPRIWLFNNGSFARCICYTKYDPCPARSESILSVYKRTGLTAEYNPDNLRIAWNIFALTGEEQNKLNEGCW